MGKRGRQLKAFVYRLVSLLVILALSLPPGMAEAALLLQATETATPTLDLTATPTLEATASPIASETSTVPAPSETPQPTITETETGAPPPPTATDTATALPTETPTTDPTATPVSVPADGLTFAFTVAPDQVKPGTDATFTVTIANNAKTDAAEVVFTNVVPEDLVVPQNDLGDFEFDPQTRVLRWAGGAKAGGKGGTIPAGEILTLTYTVRVKGTAIEEKLLDTATVAAAGLAEPLASEAALIVSQRDDDLKSVKEEGGKATGANGRVTVDIPDEALASGRVIVMKETGHSAAPDLSPQSIRNAWATFKLDMLAEVEIPPENSLPPESNGKRDKQFRLEPVAEAKFDSRVEVAFSFDGLIDLSTLSAEYEPFLVTLDEASGVWIRIPLEAIDREANTITAAADHFSTWGAGIGPAFPDNHANILLFDSAQPDLFTGRSHFSIPIWTPAGRNGLAPSLGLSYSSGAVDGVLGDIQASWVGMGWTLSTPEIARKITSGSCTPCGSGSYGYKNEFILLLNGTGYELVPDDTAEGRYRTKDASFIYIQLHNGKMNNGPSPANATGEWWEVVQRDGTRWVFGYSNGSEQLAAMSGYTSAVSGNWATLGYAGWATHVVSARWRADSVTDTHGNTVTFGYTEEVRLVSGTSTYYDRASYLDLISYNDGATNPEIDYLNTVEFVLEDRSGLDIPLAPQAWDNWDTKRLDKIEIRYDGNVIRTYDLGFEHRSNSDSGRTWLTTVLKSVDVFGTIAGNTAYAPRATFAYADLNNRASTSCSASPCTKWAYPRLQTVLNGWGGSASFTYVNDSRTAVDSWYNWRVDTLTVLDGVTNVPMQTSFAYNSPCYNDETGLGWCNLSNKGELTGFAQTTVTALDAYGSPVSISVHKFNMDEVTVGREYEAQTLDPGGAVLTQTNTTYYTYLYSPSRLPKHGYFVGVDVVDNYIRQGGDLIQTTRTDYEYELDENNRPTGNLLWEKLFNGSDLNNPYRTTEYAYVTYTDPTDGWQMVKAQRKTVHNGGLGGSVLSETRYGYDGAASGFPLTNVKGELTLSQAVEYLTTYTVTKTADTNDGACNSDCSLREAISAANATAGAAIIKVPAGTYTLTIAGTSENANATGDLDITDDVIITTTGAVTIKGGTGWTDRILEVPSPVTVQISGVTIRDGNRSGSQGGGIYNKGVLTLLNSTVSNNSADSGGGIYNTDGGTLTIINSTINNNTATAGTGGGIRNEYGALNVVNSTLSGNTSSSSGGGIRNSNNSLLTLVNVTFYGNSGSSGGGLYNSTANTNDVVKLKNTLFAGNTGGNCGGQTLATQGHNQSSDNTCASSFNTGLGDVNNATNTLGTLGSNGGTTQTHALTAGPAINGGDDVGCQATDQRGYSRSGTCDVGAYENNGTAGPTPGAPAGLTRTIDSVNVYDTYGNVTEARVYDTYGEAGLLPVGAYRSSTIQYDPTLQIYPVSATNVLGHTTTTTYGNYFALGLPETVSNANDSPTNDTTVTTAYDGLGRVTGITYPGYGQQNVKYFYPTVALGGTVSAPFNLRMDALDEEIADYRSAWTIYDGLGRAIQVQGPHENYDDANGQLIVADTAYNALGQTWYSGQPRLISKQPAPGGGTWDAPNWATIPHTTTSYDALGRAVQVLFPDNTQATTIYDGLKTTGIDQNGHQKVQISDNFGRLLKVEEYTGAYPNASLYATTTYDYYVNDLLKTVKDDPQNTTTIYYDNFGRKTSMVDPDMGTWTYKYDVTGNLVLQKDARGTTLTFAYDPLNRLARKWQATTNLATFTYDGGTNGKGQRTGMTDASGATSWVYNALGQVQSETRVIDGNTYTTSFVYDAFGRVKNQTYPSNETLTHYYNAMGALSSMSTSLGGNYIQSTHYNASGQIVDQKLGNNVIAQYCYEAPSQRLALFRAYPDPGAVSSCIDTAPANLRLSLNYQYEANGNIKQITDATRVEVTNYQYDELDRLTSAVAVTGSTLVYQRTYSYNKIGNILSVGAWPVSSGPSAANFGRGSIASGPIPETPVPTNTPTSTKTPTSTPVPTNTPSLTPSATLTPASAATNTPTLTPSPTLTSSNTPVPPLTATTTVLTSTVTLVEDTLIQFAAPTTNYGASTFMDVGECNCAANDFRRTLLKFNLSGIPNHARILSATLSLWQQLDYSNNARTFAIYRLKRAWNEGQATWNIASTGVNWQIAGAAGFQDVESVDIGSRLFAPGEANNTEKQFALDPARVQEWTSGMFPNHGMLIKANVELDDMYRFYSSEYTTNPARQPKLVIVYAPNEVTPATSTPVAPTNTPTQTLTKTKTPTNTRTFTPSHTPTASQTPANTSIPPTPLGGLSITLQPTDATTGVDTFIMSSSPTTNNDTANPTVLQVGEYNAATDDIRRTLIKFDMSGIPADATIISATLSMYLIADYASNPRLFRVYRMKQAWGETTTTWNVSSTGVNWQAPGATGANDIESLDIGSRYFAANEATGEKQFGLDPAKIQEMVSGAFANNGFLIKADVELNDLFSFSSSRATSNQPKLVIIYTLPNPTDTPGPSLTPTNTPPGALAATLQRGLGSSVVTDALIYNVAPTTNYGTSASVHAGEYNALTNDIRRTLLKFDLSGIPANALIVSAQLSLWSNVDYANFSRTYRIYRLKRAWTETGATWNKYDAANSWQTAGAGGPNDVEAKEIGWLTLGANEPLGQKTWQLDPAKIQEMLAGTFPNNGFLIKADYELDDLYSFNSSEFATIAQRPKLVIYYLLPTETPTLTLTPTHTPTATNTPVDLIFKDSFESNSFAAWSSSVTDGGDLSVTPAAKLVGNYGLQAVVDDTTAIYARDDTPASETRYRFRFHFDPNSITMANGDYHSLVEAGATNLAVIVNFKYSTASGYQLKAKARKDDGTYADLAYYSISDAPHVVEVEWTAATAAGANNGTTSLWIDGALKETYSGIDNDAQRVDWVKLGAVSGLDAGTSGTYYFDSFASNRYNFLGADAIMGSGRNSVTGYTGGQQLINNTPVFSGAILPHTRGMSSYPTPTGPTIFATTTYSYAAQSATCPDGALTKPHAVTSAGADTYCYDKNGNMVKRVEGGTTYTQTFDAENRLTSVTVSGVTTNFIYDGDGNLVKKVKGTTTTVYVGSYEVELNSGVVTKKTSYYPGGAMRVEVVGGSTDVYYTLGDHLGSASTLLDSSGNPVANGEQRYYPFGESRIASADLKTAYLFTGQLAMGSELGGIYHYGARMYSPRLGRFLSADTIVPEPSDPQTLNRFSYVKNNPLRYIDPTGHTYADCDTFAEGYNDAYVNPDGGVFSKADCWAYNAKQGQIYFMQTVLLDAVVELLQQSPTATYLLKVLKDANIQVVYSFVRALWDNSAATINKFGYYSSASGEIGEVWEVQVAWDVFIDAVNSVGNPELTEQWRQSNENLMAYYAGKIVHELFHIAIGDQNHTPFRNTGDIGDIFRDEGMPRGMAYRVEAKVVNEILNGGKPSGDFINDWGYSQLNYSNKQAMADIASARPYFKIPEYQIRHLLAVDSSERSQVK